MTDARPDAPLDPEPILTEPSDVPPSAPAMPPARRSRRPWVIAFVLVLVPVLAAELVLRMLIGMDRLPVAASIRPAQIVWAFQDEHPRIDLAVVGDSMSHSGLDPALLGELASAATGRDVVGYDFAVPGNGPGTSLLQLQQLAREGRMPEVVVMGISPIGLRGDAQGDRTFRRSPMGQLFGDCQGITELAAVVDCRAAQVSALWRWRGRWQQVLSAVTGGDFTAGKGGRHPRHDGFSSGPKRTVAQLQPQVEEGLSHEDVAMALGPTVIDDYRALVDFITSQGSTAVGVLVPYSQLYADALEARHPGWDTERLVAAQDLSAAIGAPVIDPGSIAAWWGDGTSQNIKHFSGAGAKRFTQQAWDAPGFADAVVAALGGAAAPGASAASPAPAGGPAASPAPAGSPGAGS
ncbi:MAG: hypothetical protein U0869_13695 [Chloroflexota bacterium]